MHNGDAYPPFSLVLSILALVLSLVYLKACTHTYRIYHDDRAAVALAKGVGLTVVALGLTISSTGLFFHSSVWATIGLSLARGAMIVLLATLVLAGVRPGDRDEE